MSTTTNSSSTQTKRAVQCGTLSGYRKHNKDKTPICQPCRDARNAYRSAYYKAHPEKKRAADIRYHERHPGQRKKYDQKYRDNNRDKVRSATLKWNKANNDKMNAAARRRRAKKRDNGFEYYSEAQVLELYGLVCYLCNVPIDLNAPRTQGRGEGWELGLHIDHVVPIVSGGPDTLDNVRPTHALCNLTKNNKPIERLNMTDETTTPAEDTTVDAPAVEETAAPVEEAVTEETPVDGAEIDESLFDDEDEDDDLDDEDYADLDDEDDEDSETDSE